MKELSHHENHRGISDSIIYSTFCLIMLQLKSVGRVHQLIYENNSELFVKTDLFIDCLKKISSSLPLYQRYCKFCLISHDHICFLKNQMDSISSFTAIFMYHHVTHINIETLTNILTFVFEKLSNSFCCQHHIDGIHVKSLHNEHCSILDYTPCKKFFISNDMFMSILYLFVDATLLEPGKYSNTDSCFGYNTEVMNPLKTVSHVYNCGKYIGCNQIECFKSEINSLMNSMRRDSDDDDSIKGEVGKSVDTPTVDSIVDGRVVDGIDDGDVDGNINNVGAVENGETDGGEDVGRVDADDDDHVNKDSISDENSDDDNGTDNSECSESFDESTKNKEHILSVISLNVGEI